MKTTGKILHSLFSILFLAFTGLVLYECRVKTAKLQQSSRVPVFAALVLIAVFLFVFLLRKIRVPAWTQILISVGSCISVRAVCLRCIGPYMTMKYDYLTALESARGVFAPKEALFTHWGFYPRLLSVWMRIFGDSYPSAVWFNIMTCACSVFLIYLICRKLREETVFAFAASFLFAVWPSYALYTCVTSNEHLAILFMLLSAFLMLCAAASNSWKFWCLIVFSGISAGISDCFKQFSPVFAIAVFAAGFVAWLLRENNGRNSGPIRFPALILSVLLLFGSSVLTHNAALKYLERYLGQPVCKGATAHFLWIGLNSASGGMWSSETGMKVYEFAEAFDNDYDRVMDELWSLLREDLAAHPESLKPTIEHKMEVDWAADTGVTDWVVSLYQDQALPHKDLIYAAGSGYYIALMLLIAAGVLIDAAKVWKGAGTGLMYFRLVCFGYALLLVLSEAQGRYQLVLFPCFAILAAAGAGDVLLPFPVKRNALCEQNKQTRRPKTLRERRTFS